MNTIISSTNAFDKTKLVFSESVFTSTHGGKYVGFNYDNQNGITFRTDTMVATMGLRRFNETSNNVTMFLSFEDPTLVSSLNDFENTVLDHVLENSLTLFNKNISSSKDKLIETEKYKCIVRENKEYENISIGLKLKFKDSDGTPMFTVFDHENNRVPIMSFEDLQEKIPRKTKVKVIFKCGSLWNVSNRLGLGCTVVQLMILERDSNDIDYSKSLFV